MKIVTNDYKTNIKTLGRQLDSKVTYTIDGVQTELGTEQLNSVTPHYTGDILKSVMKCLDVDSNVEIPEGTEINYQFGVKTRSGKNLYDKTKAYVTGVNNQNISNNIDLQPNTNYYFSTGHTYTEIIFYDSNNQQTRTLGNYSTTTYIKFTTASNEVKGRFSFYSGQTNVNKDIYDYTGVQLELGTEATSYEAFGEYEYIDYGNYIVNKVEKQQNANSYILTCYDKMLYSMVDYETLGVTYPITIRDYIQAVCNKLGLTFANSTDLFANYDKQITKELFLDSEGNSLDYTFRDILDQLAEATASTICINNNDELELRYVKDIGEITNVSGTEITINNNKRTKISDYQLQGNSYQYTTTGKNLLQNNGTTTTLNGLTFTKNEDGTIKVNGTATAQTIYNINESVVLNGSYIITGCPSGGADATYFLQIYGTGGTNEYGNGATTSNINAVVRIVIRNGATLNNLIFRPMIRLSSVSDSSYEPYTGGKASPNPDYPQNIEVVTGRQEIDIIGKNLYGGFTFTKTNNDITYNYNIDGTIKANGTSTGTALSMTSAEARNNNFLINLTAGTYTLSGGNNFSIIELIDDTGNYIAGIPKNGTSVTFTLQQTKNAFIRLNIGSGTSVSNVIAYPMLEKNTQATTYEPYKGQSYEVNLGKNLFNKANVGDADKNVRLNASGGYYSETGYFISNLIKIKPNTTYTINYTPTAMTRVCFYSSNTTSSFISKNDSDTTFTTPSNAKYLMFCNQLTNIDNIQLEKGTISSEYAPYFTPIELCKIGDYQDKIAKNTGKNLFDKNNVSVLNAYFTASTTSITENANNRLIYIKCKPNTTYVIRRIKGNIFLCGYTETTPAIGVSVYGIPTSTTDIGNDFYQKVTTGNNAKYIVSRITNVNSDTVTLQQIYDTLQIEENNTVSDYEPYGKNQWYIKKSIGKVVLNGSENLANSTNFYYISLSNITPKPKASSALFSNYFANPSGIWAGTDAIAFNKSAMPSSVTSLSEFKTWLNTHNTIIYYVLATPTYILIDNEELIEQLNKPQLLLGLNNINISASLPTPLSLSYYSSIETIDEQSLKNINVETGEKYGPINSIVLSRSADSDNVYMQDEYSIAQNGLCELKIADNQIMNGNDRSDYLPDILNQLNGLEYYINEYSSTGITYLELCDGYNLDIKGNIYNCIMFNDELDVTQGLEEQVHTDMPTTSETDYKKANKTDRGIKQAYVIANKAEGKVEAVVNNIGQNGEVTGASLILAINNDTSQATLEADKIDLTGKQINLTSDDITINSTHFKVDEDGLMESTAGKIADFNIDENGFSRSYYPKYDYTQSDLVRVYGIIQGQITPTTADIEKYDLTGDGEIKAIDYVLIYRFIKYGINTTSPMNIKIKNGILATDSAIQISVGEGVEEVYTNISIDGVTTPKIDAGNMDFGVVSITPVANTPTSESITFNKTFTSPPMVLATPESSVIGTTVRGVSVANITETGCDIYIYRTNNTATNVYWFAIGE